uniref:Uncharacterized protein n=1 Tax=Chromera velia CCMP2878 TaxID=1169474 RepID=A0A0G4HTS5_9ALVE|eukprot:Cvel_31566.t1-p1 / transcript=Cvel_31566.t1 / gene=Cvel_31566 / organism=Chromera_velia_CCMP2878 / gene_product=hypothetical protein / transcript_product=hypothetical protein / location=Cvel_scaffold4728:324-1445(-) / protein_length=374 / sequence_SO=supercontig / SO=protein_coding / is_pseudo=false
MSRLLFSHCHFSVQTRRLSVSIFRKNSRVAAHLKIYRSHPSSVAGALVCDINGFLSRGVALERRRDFAPSPPSNSPPSSESSPLCGSAANPRIFRVHFGSFTPGLASFRSLRRGFTSSAAAPSDSREPSPPSPPSSETPGRSSESETVGAKQSETLPGSLEWWDDLLRRIVAAHGKRQDDLLAAVEDFLHTAKEVPIKADSETVDSSPSGASVSSLRTIVREARELAGEYAALQREKTGLVHFAMIDPESSFKETIGIGMVMFFGAFSAAVHPLFIPPFLASSVFWYRANTFARRKDKARDRLDEVMREIPEAAHKVDKQVALLLVKAAEAARQSVASSDALSFFEDVELRAVLETAEEFLKEEEKKSKDSSGA